MVAANQVTPHHLDQVTRRATGSDGGVYEALVRHFTDYSLAFISRCTHPDLPDASHQVIAQFVAHGFAGAIKAWLSDDSVPKSDLVEAAVACAPIWWS